MVKCSFCGLERTAHKGVHLITNTGTVVFLCSSKCRKNLIKLGRDKRKVKWTEAYKLFAKKGTAAKVGSEAKPSKVEASKK